MKLNSPLFNRIRVKPAEDPRPVGTRRRASGPGCAFEATHRAPKGRLRESQYWRFCLDHVREYNHLLQLFRRNERGRGRWRYQKDAVTGHRPTWKMGFKAAP